MKRWLWVAAVAVVAAVGVGIVFWSQGSGWPQAGSSERPTPSASPTSPPTPASSASPAAVEGDGSDLIRPFISAESSSREKPQIPVKFEDVATGSALQDLQVNAQQFAADGLTQVGAPTVVSATVVSLDESADPPTATVEVCLDYTDVDVVGAGGESVKSDAAKQRVPTLLTLVQDDGRWLVSARSFPAETTC